MEPARQADADTQHNYLFNGDLLEYFYPQNVTPYKFSTGETAAGRVAIAGDITYHMLENGTFTPDGQLAGGHVARNNSGYYTILNTYNSRRQPVLMSATNASGTPLLNLTYNFNLGSGDNGNVSQIANGKNDNRTQNLTYDNLNRIQTAFTNGTNWGETYTIDKLGNLTNIGSYKVRPAVKP